MDLGLTDKIALVAASSKRLGRASAEAIAAEVRAGLRIEAVELSGEWADVRDPEVLRELNEGA